MLLLLSLLFASILGSSLAGCLFALLSLPAFIFVVDVVLFCFVLFVICSSFVLFLLIGLFLTE